jgi:hypothetical protein
MAKAAKEINLVALQKARIPFGQAYKKVKTQVAALEKNPRAKVLAPQLKIMSWTLKTLSQGVTDALDKALNEKDPAKRQAFYRDAAAAAKGALDKLDHDASLSKIERNPLVPIDGMPALKKTLTSLAQVLS